METNKNVGSLKNCFGCGVCSIVCPTKIVAIKENNQGFYSPVIVDESRCIECGLCLSTCSYIDDQPLNTVPESAYAGWSVNPIERRRSSSGGVAFVLAKQAIKCGYMFCGVKYDMQINRAIHYIGKEEKDLLPSAGSKYLPSYTSDAFSRLNDGNKYIVFGTPCQIASLRLWIKKKKIEERFILVDFFCHGVPSLKIWDKYLKENGLLDRSLATISWRDKATGWHDSWHIVVKNASKKEVYRSDSVNNDEFYQYFLGHYALNRCCLDSCKYKQYNSCADIRLGDLWGEEYKDDELGVSGILCLTKMGTDFVNACAELLYMVPHNPSTVAQGQMSKCASRPKAYGLVKLLSRFMSLHVARVSSISFYQMVSMPSRIVNKMVRFAKK